MYQQSKKVLLFLAVAVLFAAFPATLRSAQFASLSSYGQLGKGDPTLTITRPSSTTASISWNWNTVTAPSSYEVTITDLKTSTVVRSITTSNTYDSISGLTVGHTYEVAVRADGIIIIDIL